MLLNPSVSSKVCKGKPYSYKSDIWSLGCVLFEMMALRPPFGTAPNLEALAALVNRIVRADVTLPEHLSNDFPEASRCTRAMLRQQPDRRPTAHSLLNRPRLQPPTYELPGMTIVESASTPSTSPPISAQSPAQKVFDPPGRTDINSQAAKQKLVAAQVAAAAANAAVKAAALSPRTRGRAKLANQILESESDQTAIKVLEECTDDRDRYPRPPGQKGIITDVPLSRVRRQGSGSQGSHGSSSPTHPTYPASPSVAVSVLGRQGQGQGRSANPDGANVRSCSGEVQRPRLTGQPVQAQPLSARQKACHPFSRPQPLQRSPRKSIPQERVDPSMGSGSGAGFLTARSGSATPRSPDPEPEDRPDSKYKQRREERCRQSQAFRKWLREQRAKGKESPSPGSKDGDTPEHSPILEEQIPTEPSPSCATEYCEDSEQTPASRMNESRDASNGARSKDVHASESEETPCGPADLGGTPSDTPLQALWQRPAPERTLPSKDMVPLASIDLGAKASAVNVSGDLVEARKLSHSRTRWPFRGCPSPKTCEVLPKGDESQGLRKNTLDDSKKSVSIGDRIEGIRACLEARMGTQRFQDGLQRVLGVRSSREVSSLSGATDPWPRDSSMFLPEDIDEAFSEATTASDDLNSLVPLVAKLVACEQSYFS
eukprot:s1143_g7.t1